MPKFQTKTWREELFFEKGCDVDDGFRRISGLLADMDEYLDGVPGLDSGGMADLRLVCDEIGSNVVRHSSPVRATRLVVELEAAGDCVRLRIMDNGSEFNPFTQAKPYLGGNLKKRRVGGLGLYFIGNLFPLGKYTRRKDMNVTEVEYCMGEGGKERMRRSGGLPETET